MNATVKDAAAPKESSAAVKLETELEVLLEQDFLGETVRLDGRHFLNCTVQNCILEYYGGALIFEGTTFTGCRFCFGGDAAMTVAMLECFGLLGGPCADAILPAVPPPSSSSRVN